MSERELSPYSARVALTQQLQHGQAPADHKSRPWDSSRRGLPEGGQNGHRPTSPPPARRGRWDTKGDEAVARDRSPEPVKPNEPAPSARHRDASPEPYRKPRGASRERKRDRSRDRSRNRSRDRSKDRHRANRREPSDERRRDTSRERRRSRDRDRKRHRSRSHDRHRRRDRPDHRRSPSASPNSKRRRRQAASPSRSPVPHRRSAKPLPDQNISFRGVDNSHLPPTKYGGAPANLEKPNFKPTGLLAKAANKVEGTKISLKYHEPAEARKPPPSQPWRITVFKGDDVVDTIELAAKSCWLLGRSVEVVDYPLEHPSTSGQHAVIQFRYIQKAVEDEYGVKKVRGKVKPYIIDLESSNGTELNDERIETSRYFELRDKDILKFAGSEREYVVQLPPKE